MITKKVEPNPLPDDKLMHEPRCPECNEIVRFTVIEDRGFGGPPDRMVVRRCGCKKDGKK